jgi:peptide/nickel transport system ATP-binding protein
MIVKDIRAYYHDDSGMEVKAVDGVSLSVREGEVFGIVGESGCGKSTLASVMSLTGARTLKIKSGQMILDSHILSLPEQTNAPKEWHGEMVALLPQRAMNSLNPTLRMRDIIVDVVRAHHPDKRPEEVIQLARERLEQLSLPVRVLDSYPHQLSGGMRQRVVAVVSTLLNPKVLIADEPTSALDVSSQKQLVLLLQQLLERGFITRIVYITHDLPMLSNIAHRIAVMYAGEIVEIGKTEEIIRNPRHPYTQALIASTLDLDPEVRGQQIRGIRGAPPDLCYPPSGCRFHPRCPSVMDICPREKPPLIGDDERFASCWLLAQQPEKVSVEEAER